MVLRETALFLSGGHHRIEVDQSPCPEIRIRDQRLERPDEMFEFHLSEITKCFGQNWKFYDFRPWPMLKKFYIRILQ